MAPQTPSEAPPEPQRTQLGRPSSTPLGPTVRPASGRRRSVCLYTRSANPSGMGIHMLDLMAALEDRAEVSLLARRTPGSAFLVEGARRLAVRTVVLPGPHDAGFARVIRDFLRAHPVDLFHGHAGWGWEDPDGFRIPREEGVPAILLTHHLPFLIHKRDKARRLLEHTGHVHARIAVSEALRRSYERIGVPAGQFTTVPNGVRPRGRGWGRDAARRALGLEPEDLVVMSAGRLTKMKGHRYLIEAAAALRPRFPRLVVVILGDGDLREELPALATRLGVESVVRLVGHRPDARLLLDAADVFALPSRSEGMPLALIEAMDAGLPVVATSVIGSAEVVDHGRTGLLVPAENPDALATALATLLADPATRADMGTAARRRFQAEFTAERMVERTMSVYDRLLATADLQAAG